MIASRNILEKDMDTFEKKGYLLLNGAISGDLINSLNSEINRISQMDGPEFYREGPGAIRTIFSPENFSSKVAELIDHEVIIATLKSLIKEPFYLFQSKFNNKHSLQSGSWPWHQDFTFWKDDGMPEAKAITVAVYLSPITDISGPIICIPGSHKLGTIRNTMTNPDGVHDENLKYQISPDTLREIADSCGGIVSTAAESGSVLFFHSNLLHGSFQNMFYLDRRIMLFTYNPVSNKTLGVPEPRPEFMVKQKLKIF